MTAKPDTTLHAAFSSLKERGFTPKIQYLEAFERYPGSTRNTHLRHYLTLFWEHKDTVYDADVLEQFFDGERRSAVRAAIMRGDFELESCVRFRRAQTLRLSEKPSSRKPSPRRLLNGPPACWDTPSPKPPQARAMR